jgi:3'-phosphoadenosine 5'-phosphosulfate sulfotransferase
MEDELNRRMDAIGNTENDFINSSWVPGTDWRNTVFESLYDACEGLSANQHEDAKFMFGWLMRRVMINRNVQASSAVRKNPERNVLL